MLLALVLLSFVCLGSTFTPGAGCHIAECKKRQVVRKYSDQQQDFIKAYCDKVRPCPGVNGKRTLPRQEAVLERDQERF